MADLRALVPALILSMLVAAPSLGAQTPEPSPAPSGDGEDSAAGVDDSLFSDHIDGPETTGTPPPSDGNSRLNQFLVSGKEGILKARASLQAGLGAGWQDWPSADDPFLGFGASGGVKAEGSFGIDAKPDPTLAIRMMAKIWWGYDSDSDTWCWQIGPGDFRVDYTLAKTLFLQAGNTVPNWGYSRIFRNGDIINRITETGDHDDDDAGSPMMLKADIPLDLHLISLMALVRDWYLTGDTSDDDGFALSKVGYGGRVSLILGPVEWGGGAFWQMLPGLSAYTSLKTVVAGVDIYGDATLNIPDPGDVTPDHILDYPTASIGFFHEFKGTGLQTGGEYLYNGERSVTGNRIAYALPSGGHSSSLRLRWKNAGGSGIDLLAEWRQCWSDMSGALNIGASFSPARHLRVIVGMPFLWGSMTSETALANEDAFGNRTGLTAGIKLDLDL